MFKKDVENLINEFITIRNRFEVVGTTELIHLTTYDVMGDALVKSERLR